MSWSKQKKRVLANVVEGFQYRFDLGITRYRKSADGDYGRCWLSFDGNQLASWSCLETLINSSVTVEDASERFGVHFTPQQFDDLNAERGLFTVDSFIRSLNIYLDGRPHAFLDSSNYVQQALAICDRRIGLRKLDQLRSREDLPDFITFLVQERFSRKSDQGVAPNT